MKNIIEFQIFTEYLGRYCNIYRKLWGKNKKYR